MWNQLGFGRGEPQHAHVELAGLLQARDGQSNVVQALDNPPECVRRFLMMDRIDVSHGGSGQDSKSGPAGQGSSGPTGSQDLKAGIATGGTSRPQEAPNWEEETRRWSV